MFAGLLFLAARSVNAYLYDHAPPVSVLQRGSRGHEPTIKCIVRCEDPLEANIKLLMLLQQPGDFTLLKYDLTRTEQNRRVNIFPILTKYHMSQEDLESWLRDEVTSLDERFGIASMEFAMGSRKVKCQPDQMDACMLAFGIMVENAKKRLLTEPAHQATTSQNTVNRFALVRQRVNKLLHDPKSRGRSLTKLLVTLENLLVNDVGVSPDINEAFGKELRDQVSMIGRFLEFRKTVWAQRNQDRKSMQLSSPFWDNALRSLKDDFAPQHDVLLGQPGPIKQLIEWHLKEIPLRQKVAAFQPDSATAQAVERLKAMLKELEDNPYDVSDVVNEIQDKMDKAGAQLSADKGRDEANRILGETWRRLYQASSKTLKQDPIDFNALASLQAEVQEIEPQVQRSDLGANVLDGIRRLKNHIGEHMEARAKIIEWSIKFQKIAQTLFEESTTLDFGDNLNKLVRDLENLVDNYKKHSDANDLEMLADQRANMNKIYVRVWELLDELTTQIKAEEIAINLKAEVQHDGPFSSKRLQEFKERVSTWRQGPYGLLSKTSERINKLEKLVQYLEADVDTLITESGGCEGQNKNLLIQAVNKKDKAKWDSEWEGLNQILKGKRKVKELTSDQLLAIQESALWHACQICVAKQKNAFKAAAAKRWHPDRMSSNAFVGSGWVVAAKHVFQFLSNVNEACGL